VLTAYGEGAPPQACGAPDLALPSSYSTDEIASRAEGFIQTAPQPWFLVAATFAPHAMNQDHEASAPLPASRHAGAYAQAQFPVPGYNATAYNEADVTDKPKFIRQQKRFNLSQRNEHRQLYRSRLETLLAVDDLVAGVEAALVATGQASNTVRVFASDNGYSIGDHRWLSKFVLYEPSVKIPLVVSGPGFQAGVSRTELVSNVDLVSTILALGGATPARLQDGADLGPLLRGDPVPWRSALLLESRATSSYDAIRTASYVYAEHLSTEKELYDLIADPAQMQSRHADPAYEAIKATLAAQLAPLRRCVGAGCWVP
jgi:arylsulfatase A-like enzyme